MTSPGATSFPARRGTRPRNNLEVAASALALAEAKLRKTELKAPFSGIIGLRAVSVGDYVREGADLVNLQAIDPLKVDFRVPETFLKQVQVGQSVEVALDALPGKTYEGKVFALNPLVDAAGRAIVIRAQVRNQDTTHAARHVRPCDASSPGTRGRPWWCRRRRWCRRARSSSSSRSSTRARSA